jgi:hypothetical protein
MVPPPLQHSRLVNIRATTVVAIPDSSFPYVLAFYDIFRHDPPLLAALGIASSKLYDQPTHVHCRRWTEI